MLSSKENSCNRKNDLDKTRGEYQKFGDTCIQMREPVIKSYAEKVIPHAASNGGSCRRGFVKDLVDKAAKVAPFMRITRDDINNKVKAIQGQGPHKCKQKEVSPAPAIPFHVIRNQSISTILDLSVSANSDAKSINDKNPLDFLASQAVQMIEHTNQAQVVDGMQLTLPNRCSYKGCDAPLHLVPEHCLTCLRLVHQILGINSSTLLCQVCFK
jgi:hypothetical protein